MGRTSVKQSLAAAVIGLALGLCCALALGADDPLEAAGRQYAAAAALQNRGSYAQAAAEWAQFVARFPNDPRIDRGYHYLGLCRLNEKLPAPAIEAFQTVIARFPQSELLEISYLQLAIAQYTLGQSGKSAAYGQALTTLARQLQLFPTGKSAPAALFYWGECLYATDQKREALAKYTQLLREHADSSLVADALYAQGVTQQDLEQPATALATFTDFLKRFPENALASEVTMRRGEACLALQQYDEALRWLREAAGKKGFAQADYATLRSGVALTALQRPAEAAAAYAALVKEHPQSDYAAQAAMSGGKCLFDLGKYAQARPLLARAGDDPQFAAEAAHWLARCELRQGQAAAALKAVEKVTNSGALADVLHMDRADALYELPGRRGEAAALYARLGSAKGAEPAIAQALYLASLSYLQEKQYPAALEHAATFLRRFKNDKLTPDVLQIVAESRLQLNHWPAAEQAYAELLAKYPQHADGQTWKVRYATALLAQKKYPEVIVTLEPSLSEIRTPAILAEAKTLVVRSKSRLAEQHAAAGKHQEAAELYRQAIAVGADEAAAPAAYYGLAWARLNLGEYPAAAQAVDKLLEKYPSDKLAARSRYVRAVARQQLQQFPAAHDDLQAFLAGKPSAAERSDARYVLALCQIGMHRPAEVVQTLTRLLADDPQYAAADKALYEWAWAEKGRGHEKEAGAAFARLAAEHPQSPMAGESAYYAGEQAYRQADYRTAAAQYRAARDKLQTTALGEKAAHRLGLSEYRREDWPAAQAAFHQQRTTWPRGPLVLEAALLEAESWFRQKKYAEAIALFEPLLAEKSARKEAVRLALLHSGQAQQQLGKLDAAERLYQQALREGGETAAEAQFRIGQLQAARQAPAEAVQSFVKVVYGYSYPRWQAEAAFEAGRAWETLGKPQEAVKQYQELLEKFPHSAPAPQAQSRLKELQPK